MQNKVAIFCKTFRDDLHLLPNLVESHRNYAQNIPLLISIPHKDYDLLNDVDCKFSGITVVKDEDYVEHAALSLGGWAHQQVCKLSIFKTGFADSYMALDSDSYFIAAVDERDFYSTTGAAYVVYSNLFTKFDESNTNLIRYLMDMSISGTAYLQVPSGTATNFGCILSSFRELVQKGAIKFEERGAWINRLFSIPAHTAFQPSQILHSSVLLGMERFFLAHGITLTELITLSPWEYNWYACYAFSVAVDTVAPRISPTIHFASEAAIYFAKNLGLTNSTLARRFQIIQMAARHLQAQSF